MVFPVLLTVLLFGTLPPQGGENEKALLTASEQKSLHDKLLPYLKAQIEHDDLGAKEKQRELSGKRYEKAKETFDREWEARCEKKGDLLKSIADLTAIFDNCFTYEHRSGQPLKKEEARDLPGYGLAVPKKYSADKPWRLVLAIPGANDKGEWTDVRDYFKDTWDGAPSVDDTIFHLASVGKGIDLDTIPNLGKQGEDDKEKLRIATVLAGYGETMRNYNVDRSRVVLDFGKGATLFGLRLATHFPDRFAGLIVRWPVDAAGLRLGSLSGMPVLLLQSADTKDGCEKLKKMLDDVSPGSCTVLEATGYPFKAATAEIEKWLAGVKRDLNRKRVVLEPNDDRYKQGYWASIGAMDSLSTLALEQRPRFEVEADRKTNRIVVKARGIEGFALYLNDSLVDLDKEYVIEVNGKAFTEKRSRSRSTMLELLVKKLDANYLYPASTQMLVPKSEASKGDAAPASGETKR